VAFVLVVTVCVVPERVDSTIVMLASVIGRPVVVSSSCVRSAPGSRAFWTGDWTSFAVALPASWSSVPLRSRWTAPFSSAKSTSTLLAAPVLSVAVVVVTPPDSALPTSSPTVAGSGVNWMRVSTDSSCRFVNASTFTRRPSSATEPAPDVDSVTPSPPGRGANVSANVPGALERRAS
jgi:hypothetical protein